VPSLSADLSAPALDADTPEAGALALLLAAFGSPVEFAPVPALADVARLLACWWAWSRAPGSEYAAGALEDIAQLIAVALGTMGTAVRLWVLENLAPLGLDRKGGRP
jgi:hypothetical protein